MLRMWARRRGQRSVAAGSDKVIFGLSLPGGSRLHNITARLSVAGSGTHVLSKVLAYAMEGWILPVTDPDTGITFDALWDSLVPKDSDIQTLDLDTENIDDTPFYEPGEVDWSAMFDFVNRPTRIYERHRFLTAGHTGHTVINSADAISFMPLDSWQIKLRKRYYIAEPSVVLFALASPSLDDTTATMESALTEAEWPQVQYIEAVLERAQMQLLGVFEPGAETPWIDAATLLQKHLEPDIAEETGGAFASDTFFVQADAIFDHSVEGSMGKMQVSSGR